jgi:hypothetical protein
MLKKICEFLKNSKLEILIYTVFIMILISSYLGNFDFSLTIEAEKRADIISFFSIIIGIYIAVITIIATSIIGITKEMLKKNLDTQLIDTIIFGMIETILTIGIIIFLNPTTKLSRVILVALICNSIISFFKFTIILTLIFKANMNAMAKEIDSKDEYENRLLTTLDEIKNKLKNIEK